MQPQTWLLKLSIALAVTATAPAAQAQSAAFPKVPVERVGNEASDIVHCLNGNAEFRQFCKVGWGPKFDKFKRMNVTAPKAYATELYIPDSTPTPFGNVSAQSIVQRLKGSLWTKWAIYPELTFMLVWSRNADCWKNGVLATTIAVTASGQEIGAVNTKDINYSMPLTFENGKRMWRSVRPDVTGTGVALYTEFDFQDPAPTDFGFSPNNLPRVCTIKLSNVQTILNREATTRAAAEMKARSESLVRLLTTNAILFAESIQGADAVKCIIANQLNALKQSQNVSETDSAFNLSEDAQKSLIYSLQMTVDYTNQSVALNPMEFLDKHASEYAGLCGGSASLNAIENPPAGIKPVAATASQEYRAARNELRELLTDAWSLAVLMDQVNKDNRKLQWLIDATITYF